MIIGMVPAIIWLLVYTGFLSKPKTKDDLDEGFNSSAVQSKKSMAFLIVFMVLFEIVIIILTIKYYKIKQ